MALLVDTGQTRVYASSPADVTMNLVDTGGGVMAYAPAAGVALTVWTMPEDGDQVIDGLYTVGESPIPDGVVTSDANGEVRFRGVATLPEELWLDGGQGIRYRAFGGVQDSLNELRQRVTDGTGGTVDLAPLTSRVTTVETSVEDLTADVNARIEVSQRGQPLGVAGLDATGKVPAAQLPATSGGTASIPIATQDDSDVAAALAEFPDATLVAVPVAGS